MTPPSILTRRGYALIAVAVAAFVVYGSLVPFVFHTRPLDEAIGTFRWLLQTRVTIESRSDAIANVLLGVPLGFALMGAIRADRAGAAGNMVAAAVVWPTCVGLALAVEFSQMFVPGRTPSGADVLAQGVGSAVGVGAWLTFGPWGTAFVRQVLDNPRAGGAVGRLLASYILFLAVVQLLPLDLTASPADVYRKIRDGGVTWIPFGELSGANGMPGSDPWTKVQDWLELVGLGLPVGLIASQLPGRAWRTWAGLPWAATAGLMLGAVMETGQVFVSRHPSITDTLFLAVGVLIGWGSVQAARTECPPRSVDPHPPRVYAARLAIEHALVFGQFWFAVLAIVGWQPFDFGGPGVHRVNGIPFADAVAGEYLGALDALLLRVVLFVPFGILTAAAGVRRPLVVAAMVGVAAAAGIEAGQLFLPSRYPSSTDGVLALMGAMAGAAVTRRLMNSGTTA